MTDAVRPPGAGAGLPGAGADGAGGTGLVAVHAHPDDETLSTGALLATCAAAGWPVTLVTCTRGERGEVLGPDAHLEGDGPALAEHRTGELAAACAALGVTEQVFLDELSGLGRWVDSGMVWDAEGRAGPSPDLAPDAFALADLDVAAAPVAELLRQRRPAVAVGYEPGGGYGHPDHVQAHRVLMRAVELAAEAGWRVPCVLWAAVDSEALRTGRAACAVDLPPGLRSAVGSPMPSAAVPAEEVDAQVPVAPVLDRLLAAMRAHVTQVQAAERLDDEVVARYALSNGLVEPVCAREVYRCAPGWDARAVRWPQGVRVP